MAAYTVLKFKNVKQLLSKWRHGQGSEHKFRIREIDLIKPSDSFSEEKHRRNTSVTKAPRRHSNHSQLQQISVDKIDTFSMTQHLPVTMIQVSVVFDPATHFPYHHAPAAKFTFLALPTPTAV